MSEITKGPWTVHESMDQADARIAYFVGIADGHNFAVVSSVYAHGLINSLEAKVNATLIASAPDLLEALREAREISKTSLCVLAHVPRDTMNGHMSKDVDIALEGLRQNIARIDAVLKKAVPPT